MSFLSAWLCCFDFSSNILWGVKVHGSYFYNGILFQCGTNLGSVSLLHSHWLSSGSCPSSFNLTIIAVAQTRVQFSSPHCVKRLFFIEQYCDHILSAQKHVTHPVTVRWSPNTSRSALMIHQKPWCVQILWNPPTAPLGSSLRGKKFMFTERSTYECS